MTLTGREGSTRRINSQRHRLTSVVYKDPVRTAHSVSVTQTSQLMLYRDIIVVCSAIHTKHINTPCRQNVELLNVKLAVHIVIVIGLKRKVITQTPSGHPLTHCNISCVEIRDC
jgi:hypothetical protein